MFIEISAQQEKVLVEIADSASTLSNQWKGKLLRSLKNNLKIDKFV